MLGNFRAESRSKGPLPKTSFGILLFQLWQLIAKPTKQNLISGFQTCGLCPLNSMVPMGRVVGTQQHTMSNTNGICRDLDSTLVAMLKDLRGQTSAPTTRGVKVPAGRPMTLHDLHAQQITSDHVEEPIQSSKVSEETSSECGICKIDFTNASGPDWVMCTGCFKWTYGSCNKSTQDVYFMCSNCL